MIIAAPDIFVDGAFTGPGAVEIEAGQILALHRGATTGDIVLPDGVLTPGLIDLHNNGAFGVDCATATAEEWDGYIAKLATHGVTSVAPTIITAPFSDLFAAAARVKAAQARHGAIIGLHLEGPFLSPARRGAHRADCLAEPTPAAIDALLADQAMAQTLRLITIAPELPGALTAITRLAAAGITVSLGHSDATAAQARAAADAGASLVTHLFNAQSPLYHRAPGLPGAALTDPRLSPCVIADAIHTDPLMLTLAFAACPRAIAVTDSILIAGLPSGTARPFGGAPVTVQADGAGYRPDGTLAGAGITLDEGIRRLIAAGVPAEIALAAATSRPAASVNLPDRGRIAPGARADLIWWGHDFSIRQVWTAGHTTAAPTARGTEQARSDLADLDERPTLAIVQTFLAQEAAAQRALSAAAPALAALADAVAAKLSAGGRLFYVGAGTSGRLGLLDAVECGPTFNVPDGLIIPLLAGGPGAFLNAVEGAEDDEEAAIAALDAEVVGPKDALIGIAASGATPFTLAAIRHANRRGALTGAIVNNPGTAIAAAAAVPVTIATGPEIIAGSTRLSAGTTQKIALNILSSTVMIRQGATYGPHMVEVRATNEKLRRRAIRMTATLAGVDEPAAAAALAAANMHVKTAVVMLKRQLDREAASQMLARANSSLRRALKARN